MANVKWSAFPSGADMQIGDQTVGLREGLNYRFDFPATGIKNASGIFLLNWADVGASAVNYLQISNAITGSAVLINAVGSDTNINMTLTAQGTGVVKVASNLILNTSTPTTALQAASKGYVDSLMPSYPITLALGGTSAALTASNGGIFYSTSTTGAILSGTATARQMLQSGSSSAPAWSTTTWPATSTINQILYSSANNTISEITAVSNALLITSNTNVPSLLSAPGSTGNMLKSNTGAPASWSTSVYSDTYTANNVLYASSSNSVSGLATANNGVLITSGLGVPSISSTLPTAVQGNITSVGTIGSGTWNGSIITGTYGGTGVNNGASTITLGGSLTTSGAFASTFTMTNITNVTFPTSGTLATTSQLPANPLPLANGGTNANNTASNGGIVYSSASALNVLSGTATAQQLLMSGSNTTPQWSTSTYPLTNAINTLLYASSANVMAALATANSSGLLTNGSGVPAWVAYTGTGAPVLGTSPSITTPKIVTGLLDTNGNTLLSIQPVASAVNYMFLTNAITGTGPTLQAAGADSNISFVAGAKGAGQVILVSQSTSPLAIYSGTSAQHFAAFGFVNTANSQTITFPDGNFTVNAGCLKSFQIFTSGTAATYTKPAGITSILVEVVGGGGGGGGVPGAVSSFAAAGGGGSGGYARLYIASAAASYTYTVGAFGAGGAAGSNNGSAGGTTTFSASSLQATGGQGGVTSAEGSATIAVFSGGGAAGFGSNGIFNAYGQPGSYGLSVLGNLSSGNGGSSIYGGGGIGITNGVSPGTPAGNSGSGGGGASSTTTAMAGGNGSSGIIIVWEYS